MKYCPECRENAKFEKTGKQRHHAYEFECQECGHKFYYG